MKKGPVPPEYAEAVGQLAVAWEDIQERLQFAIWELAELNQRYAFILTTNLKTKQLTDIFAALAHERLIATEAHKKATTLASRINEKGTKRAQYVHALVGVAANTTHQTPENLVRYVTHLKGKAANRREIAISIDDIRALTVAIEDLGEEISRLLIDHLPPEPSRERQ